MGGKGQKVKGIDTRAKKRNEESETEGKKGSVNDK